MSLHKFSLGFSRAVNRLLRSQPGIRHATGTAADPDAATTMEKLDAALNNMSHGLCMFGPTIACCCGTSATSKCAGWRPTACAPDARLMTRQPRRPTRRRPHRQRFVPADAKRLLGFDHEDIAERAQNEARIAHLAFHDPLTGLPNAGVH